MAQDLETLFARAEAAMQRSKQLAEAVAAARKRLLDLISARRLFEFSAADRPVRYPQDFPEKRPAPQAFPAQADDDYGLRRKR
ncbi:hypothetical protein [Bradyrhizobium sp. USDA 4454]